RGVGQPGFSRRGSVPAAAKGDPLAGAGRHARRAVRRQPAVLERLGLRLQRLATAASVQRSDHARRLLHRQRAGQRPRQPARAPVLRHRRRPADLRYPHLGRLSGRPGLRRAADEPLRHPPGSPGGAAMKRTAPLLAIIALLGAALLATLQHLAAPRIELQRQAAAERTLLDLLPAGSYDNRPMHDPIALPSGGLLGNARATPGYLARLQGQPGAVLLPVTAHGYEGPIRLLVAITADGQLLASKVLQEQETPGLADLAAPGRQRWLRSFDGHTSQAHWTL